MKGAQRKPRAVALRGRPRKRKPNAYSMKVGLAPPAARKSMMTDLNYFDTTVNVNSTTTSSYTLLYIPTVGTGATNRLGDKTVIESIRWNFTLFPGGSQQKSVGVRIIMYLDTQPNGASPSAEILTSVSTFAHPNPDYRYRYKILRDWYIQCAATITPMNGFPPATNDNAALIQRGLMRCAIDTQFTGTTGAIADIATGAVGVMILSDTTFGVGLSPVVIGTWRFLFKT